jgi:hypothetical protein
MGLLALQWELNLFSKDLVQQLMFVAYDELFLALVVIYMVYTLYFRLDARVLLAASLGMLVIVAIIAAAGDSASANQLATLVLYMLVAGIVLLLIEYIRPARTIRFRKKGEARLDSKENMKDDISQAGADQQFDASATSKEMASTENGNRGV